MRHPSQRGVVKFSTNGLDSSQAALSRLIRRPSKLLKKAECCHSVPAEAGEESLLGFCFESGGILLQGGPDAEWRNELGAPHVGFTWGAFEFVVSSFYPLTGSTVTA